MVDLCISGSLVKDIILFTVNGETKTIDQFSKSIHFFLENNQTYRIYFEQKSEQYISRYAEIVLNCLFLPVRGVFNIITFNVDQDWENDISAFKISGYIDVNLDENTEIKFELRHGSFEKKSNYFYKPTISFFPNVISEQVIVLDPKDISKKHCRHIQNILSVSILFLALFIFLLITALKKIEYTAFILILSVLIGFIVLVVFLLSHSFKRRRILLMLLLKQKQT